MAKTKGANGSGPSSTKPSPGTSHRGVSPDPAAFEAATAPTLVRQREAPSEQARKRARVRTDPTGLLPAAPRARKEHKPSAAQRTIIRSQQAAIERMNEQITKLRSRAHKRDRDLSKRKRKRLTPPSAPALRAAQADQVEQINQVNHPAGDRGTRPRRCSWRGPPTPR